jgi:acyl-CoA thioester hydrolase
MEDAGGQAVAHYGWSLSRLLAENAGIVVRRFRIEYKVPALLDDELEITTYLSDVRRATAVRHYIIRRPKDDTLIARAHVLNVCVNLKTGQPRQFPVEFLQAVQDNIV